ncbi:DEAD/DEAH box helicase [Gordonibacter sp. Marseille-P4307]|uniref:DEAD/DEAH box helicase n=1 Tax=Gordonibacter sp. Marseille-P4307 TaxID=2161815 RepID=UPI000F529FE9|nr:DEAD/DEAH box helicase family protein [Gordonibacter sp. Marseille-P4307]
MAKRLDISFDSDLLESISAAFDLRAPNKEALRQLVFTLDGPYDPDVMQVLNLATGVGKTYLMAAFIEYLRCQGVRNVVIVTPGKTVQSKTVANFSMGSPRYIPGSNVPPDVVTPQDYSAWVARQNGSGTLSFGREVPVLAFIFNIQQLIAPKSIEGATLGDGQDAQRRKPRRFDENAGVLFDYLKGLEDLVVIADESHLYSTSAAAFNAALRELDPAACVGLTASVLPGDHVIFEYPLWRAIKDQYVKAPVLAFRKGGYDETRASEEQQLRDALQLRGIKQAYYDLYAESHGIRHLNAVAFVVCSDTDHATQVAQLLRTPEFLGRDSAVLQVDSKHDDDGTQRLLEGLDEPNSPVLAVVSVNKLKEGWDVKNIAVVVTLRAMASEVLTQQTMGRGLRLPFGKYTGVWQIDQLDIIAHQSFTELLAAENVLAQFGLEEAVAEADKGRVAQAIRRAAEQADVQAETMRQHAEAAQEPDPGAAAPGAAPTATPADGQQQVPIFGPGTQALSTGDGTPTAGVRAIGGEEDFDFTPVTIERNPRFADVSYRFPVADIQVKQPPVDLSEIDDHAIAEAAKRVTSTGDVLFRKEIVAALGKKLRAVDTESAEVDSIHVPDEDARDALVRLVVNMHLVPTNAQTARYVENYLIPKFMKGVSFEGWSVKSLDSARIQLQGLVKDYVAGVLRSTKEIAAITPKDMRLNGYMLPFGERVYDPIDARDEFVRGRVYSGWFKSLFAEESFDSYSGEYEVAKLLNTSPSIIWWHRLHVQDGAYIYYTARDRYFPDFVALDADGVYWIIEGKSARGRDDATVQAKRKAAEKLVRRLAIEPDFAGQTWGYMVAYEDDVAKADSWDDLKTLSQPASNAV